MCAPHNRSIVSILLSNESKPEHSAATGYQDREGSLVIFTTSTTLVKIY